MIDTTAMPSHQTPLPERIVAVAFELCHPQAQEPQQKTVGAAGFDLHAVEPTTLLPKEVQLIKTGIKVAIPEGFEGQVRPRSGLALKHGITVLNSPGTIDSDYRGEVGVIIINHSEKAYQIQTGDRIAQLIISPIENKVMLTLVKELAPSKRDSGGFGSTGK